MSQPADTMSALARLRAQRRAVTAVEVRCRPAGHLVATVHPVGSRWLLWTRYGRRGAAGVAAMDEACWLDPDAASDVDMTDSWDLTLYCRCARWSTPDTVVAHLQQVCAAVRDWRTDRRVRTVTLP